MSRRVLVTGGAGFIGSHLVERLLELGEQVAVVDNLTRGRRAWLASGAELYELDICDAAGLRRTLPEIAPDLVVHLAAMHYIPAVDEAPALARAVNIGGTEALLDALGPTPPAVLLFASTAAVYPDVRGPVDEACTPGPVDLYGETKLEGERLVEGFGARHGTRTVVARIFNVVGRRETNPHVVPEVVEQLRSGASVVRVGNVTPRRDYTDVRDVADALCRLLTTTTAETVFNVGSGRSVSVLDVIETCGEALGRAVDVEVEQGRVRALDRAELVADNRRLRAAVGWEPGRPLASTLRELLLDVDPD